MATPPDFPATCPGCLNTYQVPAGMAGLLVTCETCHTDFVLPDPAHPGPPASASRTWLKNALLLGTGAVLVWGLYAWLNQPSVPPSSAGAPANPGAAPVVIPPTPVPASGTAGNQVARAGPPVVLPAPSVSPKAAVLPPRAPDPPVPDKSTAPSGKLAEAPAPRAASPPAAAETRPPAVSSAQGPADPARLRRDSRLTLERFLLANTVEERLALSQHPDKIRREVEAHYRTHPLRPLPIEELSFLTDGEVPGTHRKFHLYNVVLRDHESAIPMAVEETADGYRVDWPTFIECYTHRLRAFFAAPSAESGEFRVMLRRAHYFGPPVPGQDTTRIAYTVEPPGREDSFHVWVDKDSLVYREKLATGERAGWDAESYVIVELIWRGDETKGRWVGLRRIVSDSWRVE